MNIYNFKKPDLFFDYSKSNFSRNFIEQESINIENAIEHLQKLEAGEPVNVSEDRMVGHYWLRNSDLCPSEELKSQINKSIEDVKSFSKKVLDEGKYRNILIIGIGGSALGPQFVINALGYKAKMKAFFFDNTDASGYEDVINSIPSLKETLVITITKSGGTPETANGMKVAKKIWEDAGLDFSSSAIAVTMPGSKLDKLAKQEDWLAIFPIWDWVGGRTSIWATVGLLPFALMGFDIDKLLKGAFDTDSQGRNIETEDNPALLLSLFWLQETKARGEKNLVVLPYSDRLELFGKYLQQLIMESLGKEHDLDGKVVSQGITVLGNKGSTDQHSYVQQLRSGLNDFFAIFIKVLDNDSKLNIEVDDENSVNDYLNGFFLGTRKALHDNGRNSLSIIIPEVNEYYIGALVALFERAVSFYASFVNINAYDQPGVEAGKKAAGKFLEIQNQISSVLAKDSTMDVEKLSSLIKSDVSREDLSLMLMHLKNGQ